MDANGGGAAMATTVTELWRNVRDGLRAFIARRVANEAEVEDILQEVFLRVHRRLDRLNDPQQVVPWLYRIARNAVIDYYRAPGRRRERPAGLAGDLEQNAPASFSADNESDRHRTDLADCLRPMLERLPEDSRAAVTMVEFEGLTQRAAAERLGLSVSGMKSRVQRGRRQLKQLLDECCVIELDRRRGVADYEVRDKGCDPCRGSARPSS